jgi:hypothetical protein
MLYFITDLCINTGIMTMAYMKAIWGSIHLTSISSVDLSTFGRLSNKSMESALNSNLFATWTLSQSRCHHYVHRAKSSKREIQFRKMLLSNEHTVIAVFISLCRMKQVESGTILEMIQMFRDQCGLHRHMFPHFANLGNGRLFSSVDDQCIQCMRSITRERPPGLGNLLTVSIHWRNSSMY